MKRLLILIAGVAVFAAGVSFGVARWMTARAQRPTASDLHNLTWLKRELHLTEAQAREIENLHRDGRRPEIAVPGAEEEAVHPPRPVLRTRGDIPLLLCAARSARLGERQHGDQEGRPDGPAGLILRCVAHARVPA